MKVEPVVAAEPPFLIKLMAGHGHDAGGRAQRGAPAAQGPAAGTRRPDQSGKRQAAALVAGGDGGAGAVVGQRQRPRKRARPCKAADPDPFYDYNCHNRCAPDTTTRNGSEANIP